MSTDAQSEHVRPPAESEPPLKRQMVARAAEEPVAALVQIEEGSAPEREPGFSKASLEQQLFSWKSWDEGFCYGDFIFTNIAFYRAMPKPVDLPDGPEIDCVVWEPSLSRVVFEFKDGGRKVYGLKVSLCDA